LVEIATIPHGLLKIALCDKDFTVFTTATSMHSYLNET